MCVPTRESRAGRLADARAVAAEALQLARAHGERGDEAWILHLVGGIDAAEYAGDPELAAGGFRQALALAETLGMRPLEARCGLGLAALYQRAGRPALARQHLQRAIALLRATGMTFWLGPAEALLADPGLTETADRPPRGQRETPRAARRAGRSWSRSTR